MTENKSPNLGVVSDSSIQGSQGAEQERRRLPRLNLTSEQFRLTQNGKVFSVVDLSTEGMALRILAPEDLILFPIASEVSGVLNIRREKHPITAKVRHIGRDLVGCQFEDLSDSTSSALAGFLDPKILGQSLRPIPAIEGSATWYHGPSGTDVLLWRGADGGYRRFALFLLGSYAQWEEGKGVTTGRVNSSFEESEVRGVVRFETLLLDADSKPDAGKLEVAKTLLLSSNIPQDLRKWCIRQLS